MKINETRSSRAWGNNNNCSGGEGQQKIMCSCSDSTRRGKIFFPRWKKENCTLCTTRRDSATQCPHMFYRERKVREEWRKQLKTARGRVQRGNSRVSRLQVHSLSQALLVSSKLGKVVFSTLCSPSRCFLLSGLSEGGRQGLHNTLNLFPSCCSSLSTLRHLKMGPVFP